MTAAEIQRRVDAWLRARGPLWTYDGTGRRLELGQQWRHVTAEFDADSDAARGVLLGLVREAWGDPWARLGRAAGLWNIIWCNACGPFVESDSEAETLVCVLEAAP